MFDTRIQNTKLIGTLADCMFRRINGRDYEGDYSFLSTLRALLMNRIPGDQQITFRSFRFICDDKLTSSIALCAEPNTITYVSVFKDMTNVDENYKQKFLNFETPSALHEFGDVRAFFEEKMDCRAFIDEENHSAIIAVLSSDLKKHHLAQCIIPKMLPWFFAQGRLSVNERELLHSLCNRNGAQYLSIIDDICNTDAFRRKSTSATFATFKKKGLENQKTKVQHDIQMRNGTIERLNNEIIKELNHLTQDNHTLNGILIALESDNGDDELTDFIASNNDISIENVQGDDIHIVIKGYLDIYDPEAYRSIAASQYGWYWSDTATSSGPFMNKLNRKLVMDAIFSDDPVFKIKTYGRYSMNVQNIDISADGGRYNPIENMSDRYANPHLYYANCLGSYRSHIYRAMQRGDIIGAISQCIASVHSVNVTESATFRHLCKDIFVNDHPILEGPDGKSYTTLEAFRYLTQKNKDKEGE